MTTFITDDKKTVNGIYATECCRLILESGAELTEVKPSIWQIGVSSKGPYYVVSTCTDLVEALGQLTSEERKKLNAVARSSI